MAMARASSGPAYPERFYAAAAYAGFDGSHNSTSTVSSKFQNDTALLLYALYQQATVGPCNVPKPSSWKAVEQSKWKSWQGLGNMASTEAMRLFVKILEEDDPSWYYRASNSISEISESVVDTQVNHYSKDEPIIKNGNSFPETKTISTENGTLVETQDKDVVSEDVGTVAVYDQWIAPSITGQPPKARYEHGAASVQDKMYVYGGNHNGRYLNDLHVLDLRSWAWSKVNFKVENESQEGQSPAKLTPCAGHSLIPWENKLLSVAGHTKDPSETIKIKVFHLQSCTWSTLKTYGKAPMEWTRPTQQGEIPTPRAGHAGVTVGENWFIVGGGDNKSGVSETAVLNMSTLVWSVVTSVQGRVPLASEGLSLVLSSYNGEDVLVSFGGYNGHYSNEVNVLKPSHKSTLQSKITENPVPDSVSAVHNVTKPHQRCGL
ncbi:acyl-CoA-binding domain-containing protein 4 [Populus alba x Populus x berolinensis]|nr:acyl-CoA-binding domain-containing protein 4 [Populus alba x Populus x berolinensis]